MTTDTPTPRTAALRSGINTRAAFRRAIAAQDVTDALELAETLERDLTACRAALREPSVQSVLGERRRQIEREGWTPEHDDAHDEAELALAASAYARHAYDKTRPEYWPWDWSWWKPTTPRRDLVKAAALILAEIDRLDRAAARAILPPDTTGEGEGK